MVKKGLNMIIETLVGKIGCFLYCFTNLIVSFSFKLSSFAK